MSFMSTNRSQFLLTLACVLVALGGCASAPPADKHSQNDVRSGTDGYDGWLFNSLSGRGKSGEAKPPTPSQGAPQNSQQTAAPTDVIQASAWTEPPETGLLVAGPSSSAGPPPSIPAALPPPPVGAISISSVKLKEEKKEKGFDLSDLAPENVYKNLKNAAGYGPNEKIAIQAIQDGKGLFKQGKDKFDAAVARGVDEKTAKAAMDEGRSLFKEAAGKFALAADRWPDSPLEEDALFLQGDSEFFADLYPKAHDTFGGLLKKYSNTRHLDIVVAREFAMGRYWEQQYYASSIPVNVSDKSRPMFATFGWAIQAYERVRTYDPKGPLADDSLMAIGNAYFLCGQWSDAAYNYDLLCKEYPNSEHQLKAHLFSLQANMRRYQGSAYDEGPLKESAKAAKTTLSQFGDKLGSEREKVVRAQAQIMEEQANRDFVRGQYYEGRHCYGAARLYYNGVVDEFPSTECARKSKERLEKIRNEPDEPPALFQSLFGGKKR
jgi:TolA-binding protein